MAFQQKAKLKTESHCVSLMEIKNKGQDVRDHSKKSFLGFYKVKSYDATILFLKMYSGHVGFHRHITLQNIYTHFIYNSPIMESKDKIKPINQRTKNSENQLVSG